MSFYEESKEMHDLTRCITAYSSKIRKSPNIEPLLLQIERSQLRSFGHAGHVKLNASGKTPQTSSILLAKANEERPVGRPRARWTNYIDGLLWNRLGLHPSKMME